MKNIFLLSIASLLSISLPISIFGMKQKSPRMQKTDVYMLLAEGERLGGKAMLEAKYASERAQIVEKALETAFSKHQFEAIDPATEKKITIPYIVSHELRVENLCFYRTKGFAEYTDRIFSEMYSTEEATPIYVNRYNLDKSKFIDFDAKYHDGIIRRIGEWTYGELIGDGVIKLLAFFYNPAVLKMEKTVDSDDDTDSLINF